MIIDASAIIAILRGEPEARSCAKAIASARSRRVSAVNYVEAAVVIDGSRDPVASRRFDDLFRAAQVVIEPVTEAQARIAREAKMLLCEIGGCPELPDVLSTAVTDRRRRCKH